MVKDIRTDKAKNFVVYKPRCSLQLTASYDSLNAVAFIIEHYIILTG